MNLLKWTFLLQSLQSREIQLPHSDRYTDAIIAKNGTSLSTDWNISNIKLFMSSFHKKNRTLPPIAVGFSIYFAKPFDLVLSHQKKPFRGHNPTSPTRAHLLSLCSLLWQILPVNLNKNIYIITVFSITNRFNFEIKGNISSHLYGYLKVVLFYSASNPWYGLYNFEISYASKAHCYIL